MMIARKYAHALALWSRNPSGYSWPEVRPDDQPVTPEIIEIAYQMVRDTGIMHDALDDALDNIDRAASFGSFAESAAI
jgi:hypothetical protein